MTAAESFFDEMKRYCGIGPDDEAALRWLAPHAEPHFPAVAEEFYQRLAGHEEARRVFVDDAQLERLKRTLQVWMRLLLNGPWDAAYYEQRARIGRTHVRIALPQRYMFGAMNVIRIALLRIAASVDGTPAERARAAAAIDKMLDLELAIMLETYAEAFLGRVQALERAERDALSRRLELSEARYQVIVEAGEALITTWVPDGAVLLFNRRAEELTGVRRAEAATRTWGDIFGVDRETLAHRERELLDGRRVAPMETSVRDPSGRQHRLRWHLTLLREPDRTILCAIGLDVSEEHKLAQRTRRAERLASLGTMAAGLAHEVRNPLNAAHLQLTLVDRRLARTPPDVAAAREAVVLAGSEVKRLTSLVGEFLDFARPQALRTARGDLRSTAEAIVALVQPEAEAAQVALALDVDPAPVIAEYDDEKIKQVLLNLVRNAIEACGPGHHVRVCIRGVDTDAHLEVVDDGPGLPSPDAPVFEPFFTTKDTGTGLGLAIVHRIVTDHGGTVDVRSRPGSTQFAVVLPLLERAERAERAPFAG